MCPAAAGLSVLSLPRRASAQGSLTTDTNYPNILIVSGIDPTDEYRPALTSAVHSAPSSVPVRRGTHDFWLAFPHPSQPRFNPTPPNHGFVDDTIVPTPLRGIIDMRAVPSDLGFATMREWVETMVHETGHYWLSPADLMIRMGGRSVPLLTLSETTTELNANRPLTAPGLMGREGSHWSAYSQADDSVMDGVGWARSTDEGGYARWTNRVRTVRLQPPTCPPSISAAPSTIWS
jgi:hypothetical protein